MSMPAFSDTNVGREVAINQILASIAMEELALSHILNAEGEKIQYAVGTLEGLTPPASIEDLLNIDQSVMSMLREVRATQEMLMTKMTTALGAEPEEEATPVASTQNS